MTGPGVSAPPPPLPMTLTLGDDVPFVLRREAWDTITASWAATCSGARTVGLVAGEAGSGKTRLATEFARHAHGEGAVVLYGACSESGVPYGAFRQALNTLAQDLDEPARRDLAERAGAGLASLVPMLRTAGPHEPGIESDHERFTTWRAVSGALETIAESCPVLLVIDDLHWADGATADLLNDLSRGEIPNRTCILVTFRTEPSEVTPEARSVIADLRRRPGSARVRLGGLDADELRAFVEAAAGHQFHIGLEPVLRLLEEQTGGNAFFVAELWRHLVDTGRIVRPDTRWRLEAALSDVPTPPSVRDLVATRLERLPAETRDLIEWAAVMEAHVDVDVLARAADTDVASVLTAFEPAVAAGVLVEHRAGNYRFAHSIVRQSAYDMQLPGARHRHHLGIAEALDERADPAEAGAVALHLLAALPLANRERAVEAARSAAQMAIEAGSYAEAVRYGEAALQVCDDDVVRSDLLLGIAGASMRAGDVAGAQHRAEEAHDVGRRWGFDDAIVASALAYDDANWRAALPGQRSLELLDAALAHTDDPVQTVRLEAARGRALALSGRDAEARTVSDEAMTRAHELDDPEAIRTAYTAKLFTAWTPDTVHDLLEEAERFADYAMAVGNREWEVWALDKVLLGLITVGRLDEARAVAERHRAGAEEIGQPLFQVLDLQSRALLATGEGRFDDAEDLAVRANELGQFLSGRDASGGYGVQMFSIRREQGRLDEARPFVETLAGAADDTGNWRPALAVLYAALGMLDEAAEVVSTVAGAGLDTIPHDSLRPAALAYLTEAAVAVGDDAAMTHLLAALEPHRGLVIQAGTFLAAYGAADRYLGMLTGALGRRDEAIRHFDRALRLETSTRMPAWVARTQLEYGAVLAGDPDAVDKASTLLRFAGDAAGRLGMREVAARAEQAAAGLRPGTGGRPAPTAGLTDRELAVLRLLVEGRSNRQIGDELSISHHTAANHVRAILLKAGCSNRTEAASWAVRNGVVEG